MQDVKFSNGNTDKMKRLRILKRFKEGKINTRGDVYEFEKIV